MKTFRYPPTQDAILRRDLSNRQLFQSQMFPVYKIILFFVAQSLIALLIRNFQQLNLIYSLIVIIIGFIWAVNSNKQISIAYITAYICGCEVFWRMTGGAIFYEIGKYSTILMLGVGILKTKKKIPFSLLLYFILLLPGIFITYQNNTLDLANQYVSFYLSGPFAILMCGWYFSALTLNRNILLNIMIIFLGPVIGIATLTSFGILTNPNISFNTESNFQTSGGFGPNQVSAILGLGALCAYYIVLLNKKINLFSILFVLLIIILLSLTAITFSRGGIYLFLVGSLSCTTLLFLVGKLRAKIYGILISLLLITVFLFPLLDNYTDGNLLLRYAEETSTHRTELMETEFELWEENPIWGVGLGEGRHYRENIAAHTEFSRAVAEHGILGFLALIILLGIGIRNILKRQRRLSQAFKVSFFFWFLLFMAINALRLVAPAFVFGLTFAQLELEEDKQSSSFDKV